jgi:hypothetical protein
MYFTFSARTAFLRFCLVGATPFARRGLRGTWIEPTGRAEQACVLI